MTTRRVSDTLRPARVAVAGAFVALWVLLVGELTVGNVVAGCAVAVVVLVAFPLEPVAGRHRVHPVAVISLAVHFTWLFLVSNYRMLITVVRPTPDRLRAGIVKVTLEPTSPLVTTMVANAISLTPGSLTVAASDDGVLHVHMVGFTSADEARVDIADLHRRVIAAVEPRPRGGRS